MSSRLIEQWWIAANDLGLDIQIPFSLFLISESCVNADLLLKRFGYTNGTLIITDDSRVHTSLQRSLKLGTDIPHYSNRAMMRTTTEVNSLKCCGTGAGLGLKRSGRIGAPPLETDADQ